jgi:hypothetical protein
MPRAPRIRERWLLNPANGDTFRFAIMWPTGQLDLTSLTHGDEKPLPFGTEIATPLDEQDDG